jgi:protein-L-isoaspartate O-methyltransferase
MLRRAIVAIGFATVTTFAAAQSALASHAGATVNRGSAGTFTVKAATNSAGFQSPTPFNAIVLEEGGVLTVQQILRNGALVFTRADTGAQENTVTEVTCSFTTGDGDTFTVTGILAGA